MKGSGRTRNLAVNRVLVVSNGMVKKTSIIPASEPAARRLADSGTFYLLAASLLKNTPRGGEVDLQWCFKEGMMVGTAHSRCC